MVTEGVSYRFGQHWRASAAPVSRAWGSMPVEHALASRAVASGCAAQAGLMDGLLWAGTILSLPSSLPALPAATIATLAGHTSQGGVVWPPGQPAEVKYGRLVFNTNIHGSVLNTAAGKAALTKFMGLLRANPGAVLPPRTFGRLALEPGYGLRLVNSPAYPCTCEGACLGLRAAAGRRWGRGAEQRRMQC